MFQRTTSDMYTVDFSLYVHRKILAAGNYMDKCLESYVSKCVLFTSTSTDTRIEWTPNLVKLVHALVVASYSLQGLHPTIYAFQIEVCVVMKTKKQMDFYGNRYVFQ